ncbi:sulfurtransferase [Chitinispirillales bacterium ANBcel5]|uniref:sulfurtransferase n=1 Tax=Cellulosispirillum alkaliphilum TaxID=3039283 RepID=UPI002A55A32B|nr:sulfurtransferase [Chitinispirillales bacterium ANBcel5]
MSVELITPQWLMNNQGKEDLIIIDSQPDIYDYLYEHIPGSIYISDKLWRSWEDNIPTRYQPEALIEEMLRRSGIHSTSTVVVYSSQGAFSNSGDGLEGAMCCYSLFRYGVKKVYFLNGGLREWIKANGNLTREYPMVKKGDFKTAIQNDLFLSYNQFLELKDQNTSFIVDVRPPASYEESGVWEKQGHIPKAVNIPWKTFMDHNNSYLFQSAEHIRKMVTERGATEAKTIICYCGTGREATNAFIAFKWILNYPRVYLYEGSFTEWCSYKQNPTVIGKSPI